MLFAVRNLRASRVNLLMNDFAAGLPSPLAFLGLADTVVRALDLEPWSASVLPVLHEVRVSEGRTKPEMMPSRKDPRCFAPAETAEDLVGTVHASLLLDLPGHDDELAVAEALEMRRLAGGPITGRCMDVKVVAADGGAFTTLPRGYAMLAPSDPKLTPVATGALADLACVADLLFPAERAPGMGWRVPVAVGHRLLEDPDTVPKRTGTRDATVPHVFAEPAVGVGELVSVRNWRLTGLDAEGLRGSLWRWHAEGRWVLGHHAYLRADARSA